MKLILSVITLFFISHVSFSQNDKEIHWKNWTELEKALEREPKPVFIYFNADWCAYCKKIDREVFTKEEVIKKLNNDYYALKMNVESLDTIVFDNVTFINKQAKTKRNGIHELPLLLASREGEPFTLPATLLLDPNFVAKIRFYNYYTSKQLLKMLK